VVAPRSFQGQLELLSSSPANVGSQTRPLCPDWEAAAFAKAKGLTKDNEISYTAD